jgi:hypothetical protein
VCQVKALPGFAGAGNVGIFGVDALVEGAVVVDWGCPSRSSGRGVLHRGRL